MQDSKISLRRISTSRTHIVLQTKTMHIQYIILQTHTKVLPHLNMINAICLCVICFSTPHWLPFSCSINSLVAGFLVITLLSNSSTALPTDTAAPLLIRHTEELAPQLTDDTFRGRHKLIRYRDTDPLESRLSYSHGRLQSTKAWSVNTSLRINEYIASNNKFAPSYH